MTMHIDQDNARNNGHVTKIEQSPRQVDYPRVLELGRELLIALGENPDREGLRDTPRRLADWWREFLEYNPGTIDTSFDSVSTDQMVCVTGMRVWSVCE